MTLKTQDIGTRSLCNRKIGVMIFAQNSFYVTVLLNKEQR